MEADLPEGSINIYKGTDDDEIYEDWEIEEEMQALRLALRRLKWL